MSQAQMQTGECSKAERAVTWDSGGIRAPWGACLPVPTGGAHGSARFPHTEEWLACWVTNTFVLTGFYLYFEKTRG